MRMVNVVTALGIVFLAASCVAPDPTVESSDAPAGESEEPVGAAPTFVDKVWRVVESPQVAEGSLRVFLSEGTLVMASPNSTPALGNWSRSADGLTITEEGLTYAVEVLELSETRFRIRIHSPGEPVEILFEPADRRTSSTGI